MDGQIRYEYCPCGRGFFQIRRKNLRFRKYPATCGRGLIQMIQLVYGFSLRHSDSTTISNPRGYSCSVYNAHILIPGENGPKDWVQSNISDLKDVTSAVIDTFIDVQVEVQVEVTSAPPTVDTNQPTTLQPKPTGSPLPGTEHRFIVRDLWSQ